MKKQGEFKMSHEKLKVKDLVNIGIFSALYMVVTMIAMLPAGIMPIIWILWPGIAAVFAGAFFTLLMTKVPKKGAAFLLSLITGVLYFVTGECTWVMILTCLIAGVIAECSRKAFGYKSFKGIFCAGGFAAVGLIGSPLPMWLFQESYMESIKEMGMGQEYVQSMQSLISGHTFLLMIVAAFVGGCIGTVIGKIMLKKHFEKAGIV